jgi:murein L,D-transpeptidase YafK
MEIALRSPMLVLTLVAAIGTGCAAAPDRAPCSDDSVHLFVDTAAHRLALCRAKTAEHTYDIRLGKVGLGKTREGDGKVPLGTYALAKPRASHEFGTFIAIAYPTKEQRALGYTGSAVGVHGPHFALKWLGRLVNALDTTEGCVGLATDEEMAEISAWMARTGAAKIVIE